MSRFGFLADIRAMNSACRVFGHSAKVRSQSERSHASGDVRPDRRRFNAICTSMLGAALDCRRTWDPPAKRPVGYLPKPVLLAGEGKLVSLYFTTGDADFLLITETDEAESIIRRGGHDFRRNHFKGLDSSGIQSSR